MFLESPISKATTITLFICGFGNSRTRIHDFMGLTDREEGSDQSNYQILGVLGFSPNHTQNLHRRQWPNYHYSWEERANLSTYSNINYEPIQDSTNQSYILRGKILRPSLQRSILSSTTLHMVATKSGGRPICSEEQFQIEVLHEVYDNDDIHSMNDSDAIKIEEEERGSEMILDTSTTVNFKPVSLPTLVFFSAPWCGPCRLSNPVVKEIIQEFVPQRKIEVVEVCTDDLPDVAEQAGVVSIPTIQIYYQGELLDTIVGCVAKNVLASAVNKLLDDLGLNDDPSGDEEEQSIGSVVDDSHD